MHLKFYLRIALIVALFTTGIGFTSNFFISWNAAQARQNSLREGIFSFSNSSPIVIGDATVATPYPSEINVSGVQGTIQKVTVTINDFQHTYPEDVDVVLVGPDGQSVVILSDVGGGNSLNGVTITLDDAAADLLPEKEQTETGTFKPTNYQPNDDFPEPAPAAPRSPDLSVFNGANPNGTWRLYVVDDTPLDSGVFAGGWSLRISNGITAQNNTPINIPDSGVGLPYPSNIAVSGVAGTVTNVKVLLNNFNHTAPDDVDILLVAPNGRSVVLMSDAGGRVPVNNVSLTIDDAAGSFLPEQSQLVSGTFKPTNYGTADNFPAYPNAPTGTGLSAFNGSNPNGIWSLYVVDDQTGNSGALSGGWSLAINTGLAACPITVSPDFGSFPYTGGAGSFAVSSPPDCDWTVTTQNPEFITLNSNTSGTGDGFVNYSVGVNSGGARTGSIEVSNNSRTRSLTVQQSTGCPLNLEQEVQSFPVAGGLGSVNVNANALCSWQISKDVDWITINSASGGVFGSSIVTFTVAPNGTSAPRTGKLTIGVRTLTITQAAGTQCPFTLERESQYISSNGGNSIIGVFAGSSCNWTATSNANWITINSGSGSGNGNMAFTVAPNPDKSARSGTITIGSQILTVLQGRSKARAPFDFDGDGKTDLSVFRASNGVWYILRSSDGSVQSIQFGLGSDLLVPADYDGDGRADVAVFRNGNWYILHSLDNRFTAILWGLRGDIPAPGDYDGDGRADIAVYRPSQSSFYVLLSSTNEFIAQQIGSGSELPVLGDYDGDDKTDFALYRHGTSKFNPSIWLVKQSTNKRLLTIQFGQGEDLSVLGDFDGDGRTNFGIYRPSNGTWYRSLDPAINFDAQKWGDEADTPVAGDYDGDGKTDVAVLRQGIWYILRSSNNTIKTEQWGLPSDVPVVSSYKPN